MFPLKFLTLAPQAIPVCKRSSKPGCVAAMDSFGKYVAKRYCISYYVLYYMVVQIYKSTTP